MTKSKLAINNRPRGKGALDWKRKVRNLGKALRPNEFSLTIGPLGATYKTSPKPQRPRKSASHMKMIVRSGFAGILLNAVSVIVKTPDGFSKASPTRIGFPPPEGIPTSDVSWIPNYSFDVMARAFEDYGATDDAWRINRKFIEDEVMASKYFQFASAHLKSGYPDVATLLTKLEENDAKRRALFERIPAGTVLCAATQPRFGSFETEELKIVSHHDSFLHPNPPEGDPALIQELGNAFTEVERDRARLIELLTDRLCDIRLRVSGGVSLEGECELCKA